MKTETEEMMKLAGPIMAGLLATGHYTKNVTDAGKRGGVLTFDGSDDVPECCGVPSYCREKMPNVVMDAIQLAYCLRDQLKLGELQEEELDQPV